MFDFLSTRLFPELLNMSLTGSIVILAVLIVRVFLRRAPKKWSYLLWLVVAFRLACPVSLPAPVSLLGAVDAPVTSGGTIEYIPQTVIRPQTAPVTPTVPAPTVPSPDVSAPTTVTPTVPVTPAPAASPSLTLMEAASLVWLAGVALLVVYGVVSYVRLRRRLSRAIVLRDNVWQSDQVQSPFILGFFRPRIYIPFGLEEEALRYVLAHEHCHLKRGDHIIKPLAFLLLTVHWFNPLCWLAFHRMGRDMEMSCDEQVLAHEGGNRKLYSTTLLSFAANRRFPAPSPLAFGEGEVRPRIINTLNWKQPKVWVTGAAGVLCAAAVLLFALNPLAERHPNPFGYHYRVVEQTYASPHVTAPFDVSSVQVHLREDRRISLTAGDVSLQSELYKEITLTPEEFDRQFSDSGLGWAEGCSAAWLRENNHTTWHFSSTFGNVPVTGLQLLQQEDGSLYLVYDQHDHPLTSSVYSGPSVRRVLKLERSSVVDAVLSSINHRLTRIEVRRYPDEASDIDHDSLPSGTLYDPEGMLNIQTQFPDQTITLMEDYYLHSDSHTSIHSKTYTLTANNTGICHYEIVPLDTPTQADYAIYRVICGSDVHAFRINFAPSAAVEQYPRIGSIEDYTTSLLAAREQLTLYAVDGEALTAPVTDRKVSYLTKRGELDGLDPQGTLEVWQYEYLLKLGVDTDRVQLAGGQHVTDDGWFMLEGTRNIVAVRSAEGNYTILLDESNGDGYDFWYIRTPQEAIHDWYVKEYNLTDSSPVFFADWTDLGFTSNLPARRYDADDWYLYIPEDGSWQADPAAADPGTVRHWYSAYDAGTGLRVSTSEDSLNQLLRQAQAEGRKIVQEARCYRIDYASSSAFLYPQLDGEQCYVVTVTWPAAPSEDIYRPVPERFQEVLFHMARSFTLRGAAPSSPVTSQTAAESAATAWLWELGSEPRVIGVAVHRADYDERATRDALQTSGSASQDTLACVRVEYSVCCDDAHPTGYPLPHPFQEGSGRYESVICLVREQAGGLWTFSSLAEPECLDHFRTVPPGEGEWTRMRGSTPEQAVQATLEQEAQKNYIASLTIQSIQTVPVLTQENIRFLKGSELAQRMGYSDGYLDTNYAAVLAQYAVRYNEPWSTWSPQEEICRTLFHLIRDTSSGAWILMEPLSTYGFTVQDDSALEQALAAAIEQHYRPAVPDGLYHCQSYTVVDTLEYSSTGSDRTNLYYHVYAVVLDQSYDLSGTSPRLVNESHSMDMATFTYQDGGYQPVSYRTPEHGGWESDPNDLSTFVPDPAVSAAANLSQYYPEQSQQCYEAAVQYQRSIAPPDQLLIAGGQHPPAPRYDGDGWCIYVPDGYKRAEEGSNAHWVSSYDTGAQLRVEKSDWSAYSLSRQLIFNGWQLMDQNPFFLKTGTTESVLYPARDGGCWQVTLTGGSRFEGTPYASNPERELAELREIALSFIVR